VLEDKEREMWEHAKKYLIDVEAKEKLKIWEKDCIKKIIADILEIKTEDNVKL
jgi:hypothetical protein